MGAHSATKNESFERTKEGIGPKQMFVYKTILEYHPITRSEIAARTGLRLSSVCGRVNELINEPHHMIVEHGKRFDPQTKRNVALLVPVLDIAQLQMFPKEKKK